MKYIKLFESFFDLNGSTYKKLELNDDMLILQNLKPIKASESLINSVKDIIYSKIGKNNITDSELFRDQLNIGFEMPDGYRNSINVDFYDDEWFICFTYDPVEKDSDVYDEITYLCDQLSGIRDAIDDMFPNI